MCRVGYSLSGMAKKNVKRVNYKALPFVNSNVCGGNAGLRYMYRSGTGFKGAARKTMVPLRELSEQFTGLHQQLFSL